jgi:SH3 domain-containing YSC84-like protein 1
MIYSLKDVQEATLQRQYIRAACTSRTTCTTMKKLLSILIICCVSLSAANATDQDVVDRSAVTVREFRHMPEKGIPPRILRRAHGLAIISVVKAGFIFSGRAGEGVVIARTGRGWSGPSFIGTGGAGWGPQIGAEVTDFVIVLNDERAVRAFSKGGNVTLGADASVAAGPVGRAAEADVTPRAAIYTYSKTKGLFIGASLEGAVIGTRTGANQRYYGRPVSAYDILAGRVRAPAGASKLRAALGR